MIELIKKWYRSIFGVEYSIDYFIDKFSKIPEEDFGSVSMGNHCALYHVCTTDEKRNQLYPNNPESVALIRLFGGKHDTAHDVVYYINDGIGDNKKYGDTPKERILNKLKSLKS